MYDNYYFPVRNKINSNRLYKRFTIHLINNLVAH